ncbi:hypothetical protein [Chitinophaga barathri]|uniref:Uncharacterized protein n=1 Tax=Chitinophaga barathri TaxID=1647451 RepID=A0A3N4N3F4_9BACT|nr:hypothetical protein [Chitinophaga barathri]RPD42143.1 hypothetical protein EG028_08355 [Chitinophaga barathri]
MHDLLITQNLCLHPAGQGFFYSGNMSLYHYPTEFRFVFDCGSLNRDNIRDEIDKYKRTQLTSQIDLLIISHFDADHVNHLDYLLKGIKVKKIVAPFVGIAERLFLVFRLIEQGELNNPDSSGTVDIIIDPASALAPYLDEGGDITFVDSDPENPPFPPPGDDAPPDEEGRGENIEWSFAFEGGTMPMPPGELNTKSTQARKVKDSQKGFTRANDTPLMEFLFYRKDIGSDNKAFFDKVYELFLQRFSTEFKYPANPGIDELTNVIKNNLRSATIVKELFQEALKTVNNISIKENELMNMNTTALSLLHYNLVKKFSKIAPWHYAKNSDRYTQQIYHIQKLDGTAGTETRLRSNQVDFQYYYGYHYERSLIANTLLTSDSFLLAEEDTNAFMRRYKNYWHNFWLFQVPHHGSSHNSSLHLFTRLPVDRWLFINYGVHKAWGGTWRHPSPKVITDLVAAGISTNLLAVNENNGYHIRVEYTLYDR